MGGYRIVYGRRWSMSIGYMLVAVRDDRRLGLGSRSGSAFGDIGLSKRLDALAELAPLNGARLLDIGCGNGKYTVRLAEGFACVDAIDVEPVRMGDFSSSMVGLAIAETITVQQMDAASMDFDDGVFDAVTAIEVLEHVPDLDAALAEIYRVLELGGRLYITTPNRWFPFETHGVLFRGRRVSPAKVPFVTWLAPLHRRVADARVFTRRDLRDRLSRHGFEVAGASYIFPPFDRSRIGRRIRPITDSMEHGPLRYFGMAHVVCAIKR